MTQSINKYDFSQAPDPKGLAEFNAKKAINNAFKDTPKAKQGLVPTPKKATPKAKGKAGRIVGISKDENEYIQQVLDMIADDDILGAGNPNFAKIQARYNK